VPSRFTPSNYASTAHADERHEHEEATKRLQAAHWRLGAPISALRVDKLDSETGVDFLDRTVRACRGEHRRLRLDLDRNEEAGRF
jgi:site-specific DNA recombinase